jgi:hypothetical protein
MVIRCRSHGNGNDCHMKYEERRGERNCPFPFDPTTPFSVRRAKARSFSGCKSHPATVAPAGSNRSSRGGDEAAEAFDVKGPCKGVPRLCRP